MNDAGCGLLLLVGQGLLDQTLNPEHVFGDVPSGWLAPVADYIAAKRARRRDLAQSGTQVPLLAGFWMRARPGITEAPFRLEGHYSIMRVLDPNREYENRLQEGVRTTCQICGETGKERERYRIRCNRCQAMGGTQRRLKGEDNGDLVRRVAEKHFGPNFLETIESLMNAREAYAPDRSNLRYQIRTIAENEAGASPIVYEGTIPT